MTHSWERCRTDGRTDGRNQLIWLNFLINVDYENIFKNVFQVVDLNILWIKFIRKKIKRTIWKLFIQYLGYEKLIPFKYDTNCSK